MARYAGFNNRFNAGELAPEAWSDTDLTQHAHGCALGLNMVGRVAGPMERRPGLWDAGALADETKRGRLIPFRNSVDDSLMLEFGDFTVRVWQADYTPLLDGPDQVAFVSPYGEADLPGLRPVQSGDLIVFTHQDGLRTQALVRSSNTSWAFADYEFRQGPWRAENLDSGWTLTATGSPNDVDTQNSAAGSIPIGTTVTLTSSQPGTFDAGHVGGLFRLRQNDGNPGCMSWAPGTSFTVGQYVNSAGRVYEFVNGGPHGNPSGTTPPIHETGTVDDGRINWRFVHDGAGVVKVTAFTDDQTVTGEVMHPIPVKSGTATAYWSEGAYSDYRGWPTCAPVLREERLGLGGQRAEPDKFDLTRTAGYTPGYADFKPGLGTGRVLDDDAVQRRADPGGRLVWLMSGTFLLGGTTDGECVIAGPAQDEGISPAGVIVKAVSDFGSADVMPVKAHKTVVYVVTGGKAVRRLDVLGDLSADDGDLTVVAEHIAGRGVAELAWAGRPDNLLWARLEDGGLAAFVYHVEQKVFGWTRQALAAAAGGASDWTVESLAVLPGYGSRDALWLIARREKDGQDQRRIMVLSARADQMCFDAARYYSGAPATVFSGLDHLEGESVRVKGDGADLGAFTVTGGAVTLSAAKSTVMIGLPYLSRFESLPLDVQGPGTTLTKKQRITKAAVVLQAVSARVGACTNTGANDGEAETVIAREPWEVATLTPRRLIESVTLGGDTSRDPRLYVETDGAYPLAIHALKPDVQADN